MDAHLAALNNGHHGLRHPQFLRSRHSKTFLAGEVPQTNEQLAEKLNWPANKVITRTSLLAASAMQQLLEKAGDKAAWTEKLFLVNASTVGGMNPAEDYFHDLTMPGYKGPEVAYINTFDCADSTAVLNSHFALNATTTTISTACSSAANAIMLGARLLKAGEATAVIAGGADALSRYTLNGFLSLKNLSYGHCKPFDENRDGLNLGEGAGYLLLETRRQANGRGAEILATLCGYANTNDAYHPTAPNPDGVGAARTMQQALEKAGLAAADINYINAHGTATVSNDAAEGLAIETIFGKDAIWSSTKPFTGHTLAAAGVVEAVISILALQHNFIPPNLNFAQQMQELSVFPATKTEYKPVDFVLSNSFGFGGNNVSLIFGKG